MKVCKKCGNVVNDDTKFCPECGDSMSIAASQNKFENNYQPRQYGVPEYESMPVYTPPEEPQKPKKSKFKKVLSGFAIFIFIVGFAAIKVAVSDEKTEPDAGYDDSMLSNTVAYTPGEITNGVYTNEWANLKYTIPEGYEQLDDSEVAYLTEGNAGENIGFYISGSGKYFAIAFENYGPSIGYIDARDYLESIYDEDYKSEFSENGYAVEVGDIKTMQAAYREFFFAHIKISDSEGYFYQTFFATEINGRMTLLMAMSPSATENEAMMLGIEAIR